MTARRCNGVGSLAAMFVLSVALTAAAQSDPAVERHSPSVEVGAAASGWPGRGTDGVGARVSLARKQPFVFELGVDWRDLGRKERYVDQAMWSYFWQVKQTLATQEEAGPSLFVTYGTVGWV